MSRNKPILPPETLEQLYTNNTPEQAASLILTQYKGDDRAAENLCWWTWEAITGDAGKRDTEAEASGEARFLIRTISAISEGREDPAVREGEEEHRKHTAAWLNHTRRYADESVSEPVAA